MLIFTLFYQRSLYLNESWPIHGPRLTACVEVSELPEFVNDGDAVEAVDELADRVGCHDDKSKEEDDKPAMIPDSHRVVNPGAVVIEPEHAAIQES